MPSEKLETLKFESNIYLKQIILTDKFLSALEDVKLTKYNDNQNNYGGEIDRAKSALVGAYLQPHIHGILKRDFALNRWWIQKYEKDNFHDLHTHGSGDMGLYSFILYLKATSKSAKTRFYGPGFPLVNWDRKEVQPKPGLFILFPSYIPHSVGYNKDTKRLILSGNIAC